MKKKKKRKKRGGSHPNPHGGALFSRHSGRRKSRHRGTSVDFTDTGEHASNADFSNGIEAKQEMVPVYRDGKLTYVVEITT